MLRINIYLLTTLFIYIVSINNTKAQSPSNDSTHFDYDKIYAYCLDGKVSPVIESIATSKKLSTKDLKFKTEFENRFKFEKDNSDFLEKNQSPLDDVLKIFQEYWRSQLLNPKDEFPQTLFNELKILVIEKKIQSNEEAITIDNIQDYIAKYSNSLGYYTNVGKTGNFFDIFIWKTQKDTIYNSSINNKNSQAKVIFLEDIVTMGWEEYASLGKYYPAGWATEEALFCVRSAYDLKSEDFLISYIAHESRHFEDYKLFPKLKNSKDLEYRAKLVELSLAKSTLYELLEWFSNNAVKDSESGHPFANYCVIRDLSKLLFKKEFENDINVWKKLSVKTINKAAIKQLEKNTQALNAIGKAVEAFVK